MQLEEVFGVSDDKLSTHVSRPEVDNSMKRALVGKKQIVIYGPSGQGKTTLLKDHVEEKSRIVVQCLPAMGLRDIYRTVLEKLGVRIRSTDTIRDGGGRWTKFDFRVGIPTQVGTGAKKPGEGNARETPTETDVHVSGAQDVADLIREHFPGRAIILENFHHLDDNVQKRFAFDLRTFQDIGTEVIILGAWGKGSRLTQYNGDLVDRMVEIPVEPWDVAHLRKIVGLGEESLNIDMSEIRDGLIGESSGNVGMLQELCKGCCHSANVLETEKDTRKITRADLVRAMDERNMLVRHRIP